MVKSDPARVSARKRTNRLIAFVGGCMFVVGIGVEQIACGVFADANADATQAAGAMIPWFLGVAMAVLGVIVMYQADGVREYLEDTFGFNQEEVKQ